MAYKIHILIFVATLVVFAPAAVFTASLNGYVYHDGDQSSRSHYEQEIGAADAGLADIDVYLFDGASESTMQTGEDGSFAFDDLEPGSYFIDYGMDFDYLCTSRNRPFRVPEALAEGAITIVTIGDSIGVEGADYPYPLRLGDHFEPLADVTVYNQARGGSKSWEWLPGADAGYFENRLMPVLPEADLVTITLGGNDLDAYVEDGPPYDPAVIIQKFFDHPEYLFGMVPNVIDLMEAIQAEKPDCDVAYVLYPNFSNSTAWSSLLPPSILPLTTWLLDQILSSVRQTLGDVENTVLVDSFGALYGVWLDDYLVDEVHPSDLGHQTYADIIFETLGGAVIEDEPERLGENHMIGFYAPDLAPPDDDDTDDDADDDDDTASPDDDSADDDVDDDINDDANDDANDDTASPDDDVDDDVDDDLNDDVDDDAFGELNDDNDDDDDDEGSCCG